MKKICKIVLLILLAATLAGCYPTEKRKPSDAAENYDCFSKAEEIENFSLNLTLPRDYPSELPAVTAAWKRFDEETVVNIFSKGKTIVKREEYDSNISSQEKLVDVFFDDESFIAIDLGSIFYFNREKYNGYSYHYFFSLQDECYEAEWLALTDELDGFSSADAVKRVEELAEKLGITGFGEPIVRGLTAEGENEYYRIYSQEHEIDINDSYHKWTKDDEVYFVTIPLSFNGVPVDGRISSYSNGNKDHFYHSGMGITAIVRRDDIVEFDCRGAYEAEYSMGENIGIKYTPQDILNYIVFDYSQTKLQTINEYYDCKLVYSPAEMLDDGSMRFEPAWVFDYWRQHIITESRPDLTEDKVREFRAYSAETGKKIEGKRL